jgi:hypothetical protein
MTMQLSLFPDMPKPPRRKSRRRMRLIDWGSGLALFSCRCGFESGRVPAGKFSDDKRGRPCPRCNPGDGGDP